MLDYNYEYFFNIYYLNFRWTDTTYKGKTYLEKDAKVSNIIFIIFITTSIHVFFIINTFFIHCMLFFPSWISILCWIFLSYHFHFSFSLFQTDKPTTVTWSDPAAGISASGAHGYEPAYGYDGLSSLSRPAYAPYPPYSPNRSVQHSQQFRSPYASADLSAGGTGYLKPSSAWY